VVVIDFRVLGMKLTRSGLYCGWYNHGNIVDLNEDREKTQH